MPDSSSSCNLSETLHLSNARSLSTAVMRAFLPPPGLPITPRSTRAAPRCGLLQGPAAVLAALVPLARTIWHGSWRVFLSELAPSDAEGRYTRPGGVVEEVDVGDGGDMVMYVGVACPWCHRVVLGALLLRVDCSIVEVVPGSDGMWRVEGSGKRLREVYVEGGGGGGRVTAPVLLQEGKVVCNESAAILRAFGRLCGRVALSDGSGGYVHMRPDDLEGVEELCEDIYHCVNDGVYKCGFATSQFAYEEAEHALFDCLDRLERRLERTRFLCSGTVLTEADIFLFPTVFRFDSVYAVIFRACRKSIRADYPAIAGWMRDIYNMPGVADTCNLKATRENYFQNLFPLNPSAITPVTPLPDLTPAPHRHRLGVEQASPYEENLPSRLHD